MMEVKSGKIRTGGLFLPLIQNICSNTNSFSMHEISSIKFASSQAYTLTT